MTAARDLDRLLWAVGEARRLRHAERRPVDVDRPGASPYGDRDDVPTDTLGRPSR